jgi:hypothetical protein
MSLDSQGADRPQKAGAIGRVVRIVVGAVLVGSIAGFYLQGAAAFVIRSAAVTAGLLVVYVVLHRFVGARSHGWRRPHLRQGRRAARSTDLPRRLTGGGWSQRRPWLRSHGLARRALRENVRTRVPRVLAD